MDGTEEFYARYMLRVHSNLTMQLNIKIIIVIIIHTYILILICFGISNSLLAQSNKAIFCGGYWHLNNGYPVHCSMIQSQEYKATSIDFL